MTLRPCAALPDLTLRRITPQDKDGLVAGLGRLSERSVYQRFLAPKPRLTTSELRYLTEVDFVDHYALVAVLTRSPDVIVGVGRWVRSSDDPQAAEVAIVVADDLQGRGVGTRLGTALADAARERGVTRFTATILSGNRAAHRLMARISSQLEQTRAHGVDELVVPVAAGPRVAAL
jgi:RimJ/RimL family protein N-acetyltransferase